MKRSKGPPKGNITLNHSDKMAEHLIVDIFNIVGAYSDLKCNPREWLCYFPSLTLHTMWGRAFDGQKKALVSWFLLSNTCNSSRDLFDASTTHFRDPCGGNINIGFGGERKWYYHYSHTNSESHKRAQYDTKKYDSLMACKISMFFKESTSTQPGSAPLRGQY
jgi:hypothetical protein